MKPMRIRSLRASVTFLFAVLLAGCGGGTANNPPTLTVGGTGSALNSGAYSGTYTVGGTVSGLPTGATLVLSNTVDGDTLTASASGAFTFPTADSSGAEYSAQIDQQPSGITCTVSNGSGTVLSSDVTSIAVNCTSNATAKSHLYTIGGSVSGLPLGASIVLADSGNGDAATITANGKFAFSISEPSGFTYHVTSQTAPPDEICSVSGSSGTVGVTNVTSILVNCSASSATYTVGGHVDWSSGASGTFTISLGGTNFVPITSPTGVFAFPNALAAGSNYVASITSEPNGSTCYLASGSAGYAISADVTNVDVVCTTQITDYPMTVTVSGLPAGDELYLALNGTTNTTALVNGTKNPYTSLVGGEQYQLTVAQIYDTSANSAANGVTCSVSNGLFTVTGSVSENVTCSTTGYTIGGTVNGLPASSTSTPYSVTLYESAGGDYVTVNGCTDCTTPSDVAYTFPTSVANGASYIVTVVTQPALGTTTCTVANGTGTVSSADVTNVIVTCPSPTWSVGGTVTGVPSGESVGLQDTDSGNTVTVTNSSADSAYPAFTIDSSDSTNESYDVVVTSNPPNYACTVSNGSGTVPVQVGGQDSNVTNVQISCSPNPEYVSGTVTWENAQSTAASNVSVDLLLNGQYATSSSASSVPAATTSNGSTVDGKTNSTFSFSQALPYGSAWAVSVQSVTSGWTCQLTNASGSSITANVTNVQVTCSN